MDVVGDDANDGNATPPISASASEEPPSSDGVQVASSKDDRDMLDPYVQLQRMVHDRRYAKIAPEGYKWYRCNRCKRWFYAPYTERGDIVTVGGCSGTLARVPWPGEKEWINKMCYQ